MWKDKLQNVYSSLEEWEQFEEIYNLAKRLGYDSAQEAWDDNPMIQGSVNPSDYRKVTERKMNLKEQKFRKLVREEIQKQLKEFSNNAGEGVFLIGNVSVYMDRDSYEISLETKNGKTKNMPFGGCMDSAEELFKFLADNV